MVSDLRVPVPSLVGPKISKHMEIILKHFSAHIQVGPIVQLKYPKFIEAIALLNQDSASKSRV